MKRKSIGIFGKVFLYTILIQAVVIIVLFSFYAEQIRTAVTFTQQRQTTEIFRPFLKMLNGKMGEDIARLCEDFHAKNGSIQFRFESGEGKLIFETDGFDLRDISDLSPRSNGLFPGGNPEFEQEHQFDLLQTKKHEPFFMTVAKLSRGNVKLYVAGDQLENDIYNQFRSAIAITLGVMIFFSLLATFIFARRIAKPVRAIAGDTHRMALLEDVPAPEPGGDEIGCLATDVYQMYTRLKDTIHKLEEEVGRRKEMEENQRYFFAAASHELKTPIAATGAILEGISSGVVTDDERPAYLRDCMRLMDDQSRLVTEILEVMKLNETGYRLETTAVNLKDAINRALAAHREVTESKGLRVAVCVEPGQSAVLADPNLLGKALSNVVGNAVQNTAAGGRIRIFTECGEAETGLAEADREMWPGSAAEADREMGAESAAGSDQETGAGSAAGAEQETGAGSAAEKVDGIGQAGETAPAGRIFLHVLNYGAAIPADLLPKLFEPFFHTDPARTRNVSRTGLGLTIVRKSLEMMNVPHRLQNTPDGVLFTMELQCADSLQ